MCLPPSGVLKPLEVSAAADHVGQGVVGRRRRCAADWREVAGHTHLGKGKHLDSLLAALGNRPDHATQVRLLALRSAAAVPHLVGSDRDWSSAFLLSPPMLGQKASVGIQASPSSYWNGRSHSSASRDEIHELAAIA
jgi:hypothetical protein